MWLKIVKSPLIRVDRMTIPNFSYNLIFLSMTEFNLSLVECDL